MPNHPTKNTIYNDIKNLIVQAKSKVYTTINSTMTQTYWNIGRRIVEEEQEGQERAKYGKALLKNLSKQLSEEFGKGYSVDNLEKMRRFYLVYSKSETVSRKFKLGWSHYIFLTRISDVDERNFYEVEAVKGNLSVRELRQQFDSGLYQRLQLSLEKERVKELSKKGQMMMYVNYFDRVEKQEDENPTVGIILCRDKSKALVEMTLPKDNNQIFASRYLTVLPDKEEFRRLLEERDLDEI